MIAIHLKLFGDAVFNHGERPQLARRADRDENLGCRFQDFLKNSNYDSRDFMVFMRKDLPDQDRSSQFTTCKKGTTVWITGHYQIWVKP
jgi:hypothetical protein